jgi:hypothetical protein
MDDRDVLLSRRVADAADAWMRDPRDAQIYGRLVDAVLARRAYLQPVLDLSADEPGPQRSEVLDGLAGEPVTKLGEIIANLDLREIAATRSSPADAGE